MTAFAGNACWDGIKVQARIGWIVIEMIGGDAVNGGNAYRSLQGEYAAVVLMNYVSSFPVVSHIIPALVRKGLQQVSFVSVFLESLAVQQWMRYSTEPFVDRSQGIVGFSAEPYCSKSITRIVILSFVA